MLKNDVLEYFGGINQTAKALRLSYQAVYQWPEVLTDRIAYRVELVTKGALKTDETKVIIGE